MTQFQTIVIGEDDNGFYNEPTLHSTQRAADRWGRDMLVGASVYGYVIVKVDHESWTVVDENVYGCEYSVYHDGYGFVKVKKEKPAKLVMV
jgi:hypothetical protein